MPRASDGTYMAPVNDWNPPVNGALIDPVGWEAQLADYVTAFTASLDRSGNGGMLADLKILGNAALMTEIASPTAPAANNLKLYALDVATVTKLAYKDSVGTETVLGGGGTGDVVGPASATANAAVRFNSTTGKLVKDGALIIADTTGNISGLQQATFTGTSSGSTVLKPNAAAGSGTITLPIATGTLLSTAETQTITKGFTVTPNNIGTVTTGTTTPDPTLGNYQFMTNNGASTIAVPGSDCAIDILVTNGASAGALTISGYTAPSGGGGDTYNTTNTNKFILVIRRINSISTYFWKALQ